MPNIIDRIKINSISKNTMRMGMKESRCRYDLMPGSKKKPKTMRTIQTFNIKRELLNKRFFNLPNPVSANSTVYRANTMGKTVNGTDNTMDMEFNELKLPYSAGVRVLAMIS